MAASLDAVLAILEALAPLAHAADWDNVGLLVEPLERRPIAQIHLTIDLTQAVYAEARAAGADLILAYHPPIFGGLKRLTPAAPATRTLLRAVQDGVAIYSPHTALDAAPGGMTDWLVEAAGPIHDRVVIEPSAGGEAGYGMGRVARLRTALGLPEVLARIKTHLGLTQLRVAATPRHAGGALIERLGACPGAGGSILMPVRGADLLLTGELRHHDVLTCVARGQTVVLTDHTNSERGYLPTLARALSARLPEVKVTCSARDADPLAIQ